MGYRLQELGIIVQGSRSMVQELALGLKSRAEGVRVEG